MCRRSTRHRGARHIARHAASGFYPCVGMASLPGPPVYISSRSSRASAFPSSRSVEMMRCCLLKPSASAKHASNTRNRPSFYQDWSEQAQKVNHLSETHRLAKIILLKTRKSLVTLLNHPSSMFINAFMSLLALFGSLNSPRTFLSSESLRR
jgi:hypothetical protein